MIIILQFIIPKKWQSVCLGWWWWNYSISQRKVSCCLEHHPFLRLPGVWHTGPRVQRVISQLRGWLMRSARRELHGCRYHQVWGQNILIDIQTKVLPLTPSTNMRVTAVWRILFVYQVSKINVDTDNFR